MKFHHYLISFFLIPADHPKTPIGPPSASPGIPSGDTPEKAALLARRRQLLQRGHAEAQQCAICIYARTAAARASISAALTVVWGLVLANIFVVEKTRDGRSARTCSFEAVV
jgi:hypothetical protein